MNENIDLILEFTLNSKLQIVACSSERTIYGMIFRPDKFLLRNLNEIIPANVMNQIRNEIHLILTGQRPFRYNYNKGDNFSNESYQIVISLMNRKRELEKIKTLYNMKIFRLAKEEELQVCGFSGLKYGNIANT